AIANANAIAKAYAIAIDYVRNVEKSKIFNNSLNLTVLIAELEALKAQIPDDQQSEEVRHNFAKDFIQALLNGFNLTSDMVDLSKEEIHTLDNYLYANHLIIQCKEAAVRVSPVTWEAIENRMLLPPDNKQ
ncbi:MAG TPA: histidine kinase, partial [Nostocaceae cyanobacterium]|nr:histidine kinase [Nostocaceae cyanobacterium]